MLHFFHIKARSLYLIHNKDMIIIIIIIIMIVINKLFIDHQLHKYVLGVLYRLSNLLLIKSSHKIKKKKAVNANIKKASELLI